MQSQTIKSAAPAPRHVVPNSVSSKKPTKGLLYGSLVLNGVFIAAILAVVVLSHVRTFWFANQVHSVYLNVCPTKVADKMTTKQSGTISTNTYYVGSNALQSGCADSLIQEAQLDNYRAYPDQAKTDADTFRQLSPNHVLSVTVVKSSDNNVQLAPMQIKQ